MTDHPAAMWVRQALDRTELLLREHSSNIIDLEIIRDNLRRAATVLRYPHADEEVRAGPCPDCGGGYWQSYAGPPPWVKYIPHADECQLIEERIRDD